MKKLSALLTLLILAALLSVFSSAFVEEGEFTLASYNGVNTFAGKAGKIEQLEDSTFWLTDNKDEYNLKYVSFIGQIADKCQHTYTTVVTQGGGTTADITTLSLADPVWNEQYEKFAKSIGAIRDVGLPMGIGIDSPDYVGDGYARANLVSEYLTIDEYMPDDADWDNYNDMNSYTVVENNGRKYLIFQLELWPRAAALDWFKTVMNQNPDKYAIIFTPSFIDDSGKMYTMWNWDNGFSFTGTTGLKSRNITNSGRPRDGEGVWNYAFKDYDNILAVISSKVKTDGIVMSKVANERGIETALIAANADIRMNIAKGPTVLLTKFSADNTEITCAWSTMSKGVDKTSIQTVKLEKIGTLPDSEEESAKVKIPLQYNGANKAYIFGYENGTFRPNANMTRAEACTIFARLILGVQDIPSEYTTRFTDVKSGDWYYNAIAFLDENGFFDRNTNSTYKPNEPITRAEFVELASLASNIKKTKNVSFADVSESHFYYNSIMAAAGSGLVNGYEDGTFRPDNTITRAEVVTVVNRLLGLKVSEKTVAVDKLQNIFSDIETHWARYNIMMASNSNVHGEYYYNASLEGVKETSSEYVFANKHFSFTVSKKNGKVTEIINLYNGEDINQNTSSPQFIYITDENNTKVVPSALETEGNRIKVTFKNGVVTYLIVDVHDNFMSFEIDSEIPKSVKSVTFSNLITNLPTSKTDEDFLLNAVGMSAWTNPVNNGYRENASSTIAHSYTTYDAGTMGAKLGVVFSKRGDALDYLKEVMDAIDPSVGLTSTKGGAYARDWEGNFGDYAIINDLNPEKLDENLKLAVEIGIDQYDVHQGANTVRQGDFHFAYTESGTATEYYEKIGKRIEEAGLVTALHTYAYYISPNASGILTNPKWQKQLETLESYTLRKNMSATARNIATVEDASGFNTTYNFFQKNTTYVLIDEEIIKIGATSPSGLINCTRGIAGTTPAKHEKGATVYHLSGYFGMFCPILGSELFYHIADLTAKAYNEGGFDMIYFDAIDGLNKHLPAEDHETWYYFHMFIQRTLSQCEKTPMVETSSDAPSEWNVRGREGAWDYANFSIKKHIANHIAANLHSMKSNMTTTLGWFSFMPDETPTAGLKNTIGKSLFHDDLDYLGTAALVYDMSMVFHPLNIDSVKNNPFHYANIKYYTDTYSKLRKSHYFNDDVLEKVKSIGGEWRVIEKTPGVYAFQRMYYNKVNLGNAKDGSLNTLRGTNPFMAQTPFIRIEQRYSTLFENPVTLASFDETKTLGEQSLTKSFGPLDMTKNMAVVVRVKGTGQDGDAALISLSGGVTGEKGGRGDLFIDLNFEGWREFVLLDSDNVDWDTSKYKFTDIVTTGSSFPTYRFIPIYSTISKLIVRLSGNTAKNASFGDVVAYTHTEAPVKNPTVSVGSSKVTFNCEMTGGEYLEYDPFTGKATLYHNGEQTTEEVSFTGKLEVASGEFTASYSAEAMTDAPTRARLTVGFLGEEVTNS